MNSHSPLFAYIGEHDATLYARSGHNWSLVGNFVDKDPMQAWTQAIGNRRPLSIIADVIELDMREEHVPRARGLDRRALLQRKLAQTFRKTPYRALISVRPGENEGRKSLQLLLGALTNPELVDSWISPLLAQGTPLRALTAVPHLVAPAAARLRPDSPYLLAVTIEPSAGIRLTYVRDGRLQFSRLGPMPDELAALPRSVTEEAIRTDQYLASLRLHDPRQGPLEVLVLVPPAHAGLAWSDEVMRTDTMRLSTEPQSRMLGTAHEDELPQASGFAPIAVRLAAATGPTHVYGGTSVRLNWLLYNVRQLLKAVAIAVPVLACAVTSLDVWQIAQASRETSELVQREKQARADYDRLRQSFPSLDVSAEQVKQSVALADSAVRDAPDSLAILRTLGAGFDAVPQAQLHKLAWFSPALAPTEARAEGLVAPESGAPPAPAEASPDAAKPTGAAAPVWVATIEGRIVTARGYRDANLLARALANSIQKAGDGGSAPGHRVVVELVKMPFDESPETELQGERRGAERLAFKARVAFHLQVPEAGR